MTKYIFALVAVVISVGRVLAGPAGYSVSAGPYSVGGVVCSATISVLYDCGSGTAQCTASCSSAAGDARCSFNWPSGSKEVGNGEQFSISVSPGSQISASAGGKWAPDWNYLHGGNGSPVTLGGQKKVTVSVRNDSAVSKEYQLMQGTDSIGSLSLASGNGLIQQFQTCSQAEVFVLEKIRDYQMDGTSWVAVPGAVNTTDVTPRTYTPGAAAIIPSDNGTPTYDIPQGPAPADTSGGASSGTVWTPATDSTTPTDLLTKPVYREGVDKITSSIRGVSTSIGVINTQMTQANTKLGTIADGLQADREQRAADNAAASNAAAQAITSGQQQGAEAGTAAAMIIGTAPTAAPVAPAVGDYHTAMQITLPAAFGGKTIDMDPMSRPGLKSIANAFRTALAWLVLVTLGGFIWKEMSEWVRGFSTIRQASGNPVAAGTGAQATALIAAGLMTAAIVVAMTALVSWSFGDITFAMIKSQATIHPLAGFSAAVIGFLAEFFPIATIVSALIARFTFNLYGSALFATCSAVIRFIVP